jgi:hypothetical protein
MTERIRHFKSLRLRYGYATLISLFILSSSIHGRATISGITALLLTLPLPLYFARKTWRAHVKLVRSYAQTSQALTKPSFSLSAFLTQPNLGFHLSLLLIVLTLWTGLARSYAEHKTISAHAPNSTLDYQHTTNN